MYLVRARWALPFGMTQPQPAVECRRVVAEVTDGGEELLMDPIQIAIADDFFNRAGPAGHLPSTSVTSACGNMTV